MNRSDGEGLDADQRRRMDALSPERLRAVDAALLAAAGGRWIKIARLVGGVMADPADPAGRVPGWADVCYAKRVRRLVADGRLQARGDPA